MVHPNSALSTSHRMYIYLVLNKTLAVILRPSRESNRKEMTCQIQTKITTVTDVYLNFIILICSIRARHAVGLCTAPIHVWSVVGVDIVMNVDLFQHSKLVEYFT